MPRPSFQKGESGNPNGRPRGAISPLTRAKTIILTIFQENEEGFKKELRKRAKENPVFFYEKFVAPFMPKELLLSGGFEVENVAALTKEEVFNTIDEFEIQLKKTPKNSKKSA